MKTIVRIILVLLFALQNFYGRAQDKNTDIYGKVISFEESFSLKGASLTIKDTHKSTSTRADGTFNLKIIPGEDKILIVSLPGYETTEISITSKNRYDVVLKQTEVKAAAALPNNSFTVTRLNNSGLSFAGNGYNKNNVACAY